MCTSIHIHGHLHKYSEKPVERTREWHIIAPKLFTSTPDSIFGRLNWENKGVAIDGECIINLCFAYYKILMRTNTIIIAKRNIR